MKNETKENQTRPSGTPNPQYNQPMPSPAYNGTNPMPNPAYPNQNMNNQGYNNQSGMSPAYTNQVMPSPGNMYQYPQQSPGYSTNSPHPHNYNQNQPMTSPGPQQQYNSVVPSPAPVMNNNFSQVPNTYPQQQNMLPNYQQQHQQNQSYGSQYPQQYNNQIMGNQHHHMYNPMMSQQQRYPSVCGTQNGQSYGMGQNNYNLYHSCGHFAPPNLPSSAYQAPCMGCQTRNRSTLTNDISQYQNQQAMMNNWQGSQMNLNQYNTNQQYGPQQMGMVPHGGMGYNPCMTNNQYQTPAMNGGITPMQYPSSVASDVQCKDVSQSSQSRAGVIKAKVTNKTTNDQPPAQQPCPNPILSTQVEPKPEEVKSAETKPEDTKQNDTKPIDSKPEDSKNNGTHGYMKPDTYQRTLEYVQQCQSWSSTVVKEEVTSSTDQKPKLNTNGTVAGYTVPHPTVSLSTPTPQNRFSTPLPAALTETSNMVINDMTSSLTSLQEENKYLQLLQ